MKTRQTIPCSTVVPAFIAAAIVLITLVVPATSQAQSDGTWTATTSGNWSDTLNWGGGTVAEGGGAAYFNSIDVPAGALTVTLDSDRNVGSMAFGDLDTSTAGTWALAGTATLTLSGTATVTTDVAATIAPVVAGASGLTKEGSGNLTLSSANTFTGALVLNASGLTLSNTNAYAGGTTIASGATLTLGLTTSYSTGGLGGGTVEFTGGTLASTMGNNNTLVYSNPINVAAGQSGLINTPNRFEMTSAVTGSGTLTMNIITTVTRADFRNSFAGFSGNLYLTGSGTCRFRINQSGAQFNAGGLANTALDIAAGVGIQAVTNTPGNTIPIGALSGGGALYAGTSGAPNYVVGGLNTDTTFAGTLQGNARLTKQGTGTLTLTGASTNTGITVINASGGTLRIGDGGGTGSLGTGDVTLNTGSTLEFARGGTLAVANLIGGTGSVLQSGPGTTVLGGTNTFTGTVSLTGGTLAITADANLGNAANAISFPSGAGTLASDGDVTTSRSITAGAGANATLAGLDVADTLTIAGTVSGDGGLVVAGNGVVTLTAANTYGSSTSVQSGTLVAANATGSATSTGVVSVAGGALGGDGSAAGAVTVAAGGGLKPGAVTPLATAVGDLATGPLTLAGGSALYTEFANASSYDVVRVGGNLQTSGASVGNPVLVDIRIENSAAKWTTLGTYNIIQYAGSFSGNANDLFEVTPGSVQAGLTYTFAAAGNFITLTIAGQAPPEWNADADGNWTTAGNWLNGVPNATGVTAILGPVITAARMVTVDTPVTLGALVFNNANTYTVGGTATLSLDATTGDASASLLAGSHEITAPLALVDSLNLSLTSAAETLTLSGIVSGGGALVKSTPGNLVLSGPNTFVGGIAFAQGNLAFANGGLGLGTPVALSDTTLTWATGNFEDISTHAVGIGGASVTFNTNGNDVTLMNPIGESGTGMMVKAGAGTLTLGEAATHTGGTTINEGTLQLGIGGATGGVIGDITNNAVLAVNLEGGASLANRVTGSGSLVHAGSGVLTLPLLAAANTFSGTTTVLYAGSTLVLEDALALQNSTWATTADGGTLGFGTLTAATLGGLAGDQNITLANTLAAAVALSVGNNNQNTTYAGVLSGAGSLVKIGTGTLTLTGANTYTGATPVSAGTLEIAAGGAVATTNATSQANALLLINGGSLTASTQTIFYGGGANGIRVEAGTATFNGGLLSSQNDGSLCLVNGGAVAATNIELRRTASFGNGADPSGPASTTSGLVVNGGLLQVSGNLNIATGNSSASVLVNGGLATVAGAVNIGMSSNNRWSILEVRGGEFVSTEAVNGVVITQSDDDKAQFLVSGGTAMAEKMTFGGAAAVTGTARLTVSSGSLYLGEGGMAGNGSVTAQVQFNGGTIGAKAAWATDLAVVLGGAATVKAASATDEAFAVALNGGISGTGSLTKTGAGTLTLGGTVAYTGNTTVEAGTLVVATNTATTFDDASTVTIAAGAVLNLPNAATDIVGSLVVNGAPLANGVYDAANPATTGYLTGPGKIQVGLPGYAGWAATNAGGQAADLDYDNDGVKNGVEYFMGETGSTFTANPAIVDGKVTWPKSPEFTGSYAVETSPDLATWTPTTEGVIDNGTSVEVSLMPMDDGKRFVRLSVIP